jgi:hypothetical protein
MHVKGICRAISSISANLAYFRVISLSAHPLLQTYPVNKYSSIWRSLWVNVSNTILGDVDMNKKTCNDTNVFGTECAMLRCIHSIEAAVNDGIHQGQIVDLYVKVVF